MKPLQIFFCLQDWFLVPRMCPALVTEHINGRVKSLWWARIFNTWHSSIPFSKKSFGCTFMMSQNQYFSKQKSENEGEWRIAFLVECEEITCSVKVWLKVPLQSWSQMWTLKIAAMRHLVALLLALCVATIISGDVFACLDGQCQVSVSRSRLTCQESQTVYLLYLSTLICGLLQTKHWKSIGSLWIPCLMKLMVW